MRVDRQAVIFFNCGAPESGKSYDFKLELARRRPGRLIAIDPADEYLEGCGALHTRLADLIQATSYATFHARFRPSHVRARAEKQFDLVCRHVRWHVDPQPGQARPPSTAPIVFLVDELANYIGPSFRDAPESFQWIVREGRKFGVLQFYASQRPAEISKTVFDLASRVRTGRLNTPTSRRTLAEVLDVPLEDVRSLVGVDFIARDMRTGKIFRSIDRSKVD